MTTELEIVDVARLTARTYYVRFLNDWFGPIWRDEPNNQWKTPARAPYRESFHGPIQSDRAFRSIVVDALPIDAEDLPDDLTAVGQIENSAGVLYRPSR